MCLKHIHFCWCGSTMTVNAWLNFSSLKEQIQTFNQIFILFRCQSVVEVLEWKMREVFPATEATRTLAKYSVCESK